MYVYSTLYTTYYSITILLCCKCTMHKMHKIILIHHNLQILPTVTGRQNPSVRPTATAPPRHDHTLPYHTRNFRFLMPYVF